MPYQKIIIVTRKTMLEELIERHGTRDQAAFLLKNRGQSIDDIQDAHHHYTNALSTLKSAIPSTVRHQIIERHFLPNFLFGPNDLIKSYLTTRALRTRKPPIPKEHRP